MQRRRFQKMHTIINLTNQTSSRNPLVNLNETWPELGRRGHTINSRQISAGWVYDRRKSETIAEGSGVEWEERREGDLPGVEIDVNPLELGDGGSVLLVDVDELEAGAVGLPLRLETGLGDLEAELDGLGLRLDVAGVGLDGQGTEDFEVDGVEVGAGAGDDEVLVERGEGEVPCAGCQEGKGAGDLVLELAVEAVLFTFLPDNGGDAPDQTGVAIGTHKSRNVLKRAQDHIGESGGKGDGIVEVVDREVVLARLHWSVGVELRQGVVGVDGVELFLGLNGGESIDEKVHVSAIIPEARSPRLDEVEKCCEV